MNMKKVCSFWYIHIWPIAAYSYEAVPHISMDRIIRIYTLYKSQFFLVAFAVAVHQIRNK